MGRSKREIFGFLKVKLRNRIQGWQTKLLSKAGREIFLKAVGEAIPSYCTSALIPTTKDPLMNFKSTLINFVEEQNMMAATRPTRLAGRECILKRSKEARGLEN